MKRIADDVIREVQQLLVGGLSHRKIAEATGVSRGTVGNIAAGRRELEDSGNLLQPSDVEESPSLCLLAEHQERYKEIRVRKEREAMRKKPPPVETQIIPFPSELDNRLRLWDI